MNERRGLCRGIRCWDGLRGVGIMGEGGGGGYNRRLKIICFILSFNVLKLHVLRQSKLE
jgi:hypothetical protein